MRVAIIPARGGSTRIPRKNIKQFHGKPIIEYSIEAADRSGLFDVIYVSTEDAQIALIATKAGAKIIKRPKELAQDNIGTQEVMRHACLQIGDLMEGSLSFIACCIYPTAPLLNEEELKRGLDALQSNRTNHYAFSVGQNPLHDAGQFYFGYAWAFANNEPLISEKSVMVPISADRDCDINTLEDWQRAEEMYVKLNR